MRTAVPFNSIAAVTFILICGCARDQLRYSSHRTSATATDILTRQVLDNLARAAETPAALPYFSVVGNGSVQITDGGTLGSNTTMAPHAFAQELLSLGASRNITEQWALGATTNPPRYNPVLVLHHPLQVPPDAVTPPSWPHGAWPACIGR